MKRVRFTEEQIIAVLREHEAGAKTAEQARKHGSQKQPYTIGRPSTAAWSCPGETAEEA
jgi:Transposase